MSSGESTTLSVPLTSVATEDTYKIQILIVLCVIGGILLVLIAVVVYLILWVRKLQNVVRALDPVSSYKKIGPSVYVKRPQRDTSSLSSSFKHFNVTNQEAAFENNETIERPNIPSKKPTQRDSVGTLDRNYFNSKNFSFDNDADWEAARGPRIGSDRTQRKKSESDAMEAISKLDKVLY